MITGDMDSLPKDILELFENTNTQIICTPDQENTDFTKSLIELKDQCIRENIHVSRFEKNQIQFLSQITKCKILTKRIFFN